MRRNKGISTRGKEGLVSLSGITMQAVGSIKTPFRVIKSTIIVGLCIRSPEYRSDRGNEFLRSQDGNVQFTLELKKAITQRIQGTRSHDHFSYRVLYYLSLSFFSSLPTSSRDPRVTATLSLLSLFF